MVLSNQPFSAWCVHGLLCFAFVFDCYYLVEMFWHDFTSDSIDRLPKSRTTLHMQRRHAFQCSSSRAGALLACATIPSIPYPLYPHTSDGSKCFAFQFLLDSSRCMTGSHCHAAVWLWQAVAREGQRTAVLPVARALPLLMLAQKIQEMSR